MMHSVVELFIPQKATTMAGIRIKSCMKCPRWAACKGEDAEPVECDESHDFRRWICPHIGPQVYVTMELPAEPFDLPLLDPEIETRLRFHKHRLAQEIDERHALQVAASAKAERDPEADSA
jgi:hypothetical protein